MTQADRDRLVTLKKAKKRLTTQREIAGELGLSIRQVKRLLKDLYRGLGPTLACEYRALYRRPSK
jgi:DNA-binding MarR family transcriptional regulator